jgi:hypothetical protein
MIDLFEFAEQQAREGMGQALGHAEEARPGWGEVAYEYLLGFAQRHASFISEDVSDETKETHYFPQPPTDRAWGSVYRRALKEGIIARDGVGRSRRRHASICPRWRSQIYRV